MNITAILAGAAVALVLWVLALGTRGSEGRSLGALALASILPLLAVGTTHHLQGASFGYPPKEFMHAAMLAGVGAVPLALLAGLHVRRLQWLALLGFALGAVALFLLFTESLHERYWEGRVLLHVGCLSGAAVLAYGGRLAAEAQGRTTEAALATGLATLGAALALGESTGIAAMDAAALSSSAGLFGLMLVGLSLLGSKEPRPVTPLGRAAATTQVALFAGLLGNGVLYAETPQTAGFLLLTAPLIVLLPGRSLFASVVRLILVAGCAGLAAFLSQVEPNPYG